MWVAVNALALAIGAWLVEGIRVTGDNQALQLVVVALIFGVINAVIRPIVMFFSIPFIVLTLGLVIFVINALLLMLTGWISDQIGLGFHVDGFWSAVLGSIVITIATWLLELVLPDGK